MAAGSLGRRRLGIELRELRRRAGLTLDEVAERFDWSVSKASRQELGRIPITRRDLNDLLDLYRVTDAEHRETLLTLAHSGRQRDWWHRFDDVLPRQFSVYLGFEADATAILTYEPLLVPGLFQTADYARALVRAARPQDKEEDVERRVESRIQRQEILKREQPPDVCAIVDEAAIRREVGGPEIMRAQLAKLVDVSKQPGITLQVVPFHAGAYMSMESGFILLGFADPNNHDVACVDLLTRSLYLEDHGEVGRYRVAFEHLRANAASPAESRKIVAAIVKEMRT